MDDWVQGKVWEGVVSGVGSVEGGLDRLFGSEGVDGGFEWVHQMVFSVWFFSNSFEILDSFIISLHVLIPAKSEGYCDFPSTSLTNVIVARGRIWSPMVRTYIGVYGFTSDITVFCFN